MSENSEKISKAIELIEKARHIGILLKPDASVDELVSAEVLWRTLETKGKNLGLIARPTDAALAIDQLKSLTRSPTLPREFIISLNTSRAPIREMRYEKEGELLNIILSPSSSSMEESSVSFKKGKTLCDVAILIGVETVESIEIKNVEPAFFTQTPLINIDVSRENKSYADTNLVDQNKVAIAEIIYEFLTALEERPLGKDEATLLLAGLVEKSNGFEPSLTNADLALTFSELLRLGADYSLAKKLARRGAPIELQQLLGRATVRSKKDDGLGILWSFLTPEDFEKTGRNSKDSPSVIKHLEHLFGANRLTTLLFQEKKEYPVQALLAGEKGLLDTISAREPGSYQSPYLLLSTPFPSFRDAEEYLSLLLSEVL